LDFHNVKYDTLASFNRESHMDASRSIDDLIVAATRALRFEKCASAFSQSPLGSFQRELTSSKSGGSLGHGL
jgi:hypothetical protein